jgi:hypothetical protein
VIADASAALSAADGEDRAKLAEVVRVASKLRDHGRAELSAGVNVSPAEQRRIEDLTRSGAYVSSPVGGQTARVLDFPTDSRSWRQDSVVVREAVARGEQLASDAEVQRLIGLGSSGNAEVSRRMREQLRGGK